MQFDFFTPLLLTYLLKSLYWVFWPPASWFTSHFLIWLVPKAVFCLVGRVLYPCCSFVALLRLFLHRWNKLQSEHTKGTKLLENQLYHNEIFEMSFFLCTCNTWRPLLPKLSFKIRQDYLPLKLYFYVLRRRLRILVRMVFQCLKHFKVCNVST